MLSYKEYIESRKDSKYKNGTYKCRVCGKPGAYWEIGDARYWCPGCDEHAGLPESYSRYVKATKGE